MEIVDPWLPFRFEGEGKVGVGHSNSRIRAPRRPRSDEKTRRDPCCALATAGSGKSAANDATFEIAAKAAC
jgi:hypothetical protein